MICNYSAPHFQDKDLAREYLETLRWPDGSVCPHCGGVEKIYSLKGEASRPGLYKCGSCREQSTVMVNTLLHGSKIPLNKWLMAVFLICFSKNDISSNQLRRMLGINYKSAWLMAHRIRESMKDTVFTTKLDSRGDMVEVSKIFWSNKKRAARE